MIIDDGDGDEKNHEPRVRFCVYSMLLLLMIHGGEGDVFVYNDCDTMDYANWSFLYPHPSAC